MKKRTFQFYIPLYRGKIWVNRINRTNKTNGAMVAALLRSPRRMQSAGWREQWWQCAGWRERWWHCSARRVGGTKKETQAPLSQRHACASHHREILKLNRNALFVHRANFFRPFLLPFLQLELTRGRKSSTENQIFFKKFSVNVIIHYECAL